MIGLLLIAARNLKRNWLRTILTVLAVALLGFAFWWVRHRVT